MKRIHLPTLLMHLALLLLARLTINDYPDFFLGCAIVVLILHVGLAIESKRNFLLSHGIGIGLFRISGGFYGMGSGFGWLFYGVALAVSFAVLSILRIVRMIRKS